MNVVTARARPTIEIAYVLWAALAIAALILAKVMVSGPPKYGVAIVAAVAVLVLGGIAPKLALHLTIFTGVTALPAVIPAVVSVGGSPIAIYEPSLALSALWLLATRPTRQSGPLARCWVLAGLFLIAAGLGVVSHHEIRRVLYDLRGPLDTTLAIVVGICLWERRELFRSLLRSVSVSLWASAVICTLGSLGIIRLNGRSEAVGLYLQDRVDLVAGASRFINGASHFSLAVVCVCIGLMASHNKVERIGVRFLLPASAICVLSFSRNTIVAVAVVILLAWLASPGRGTIRVARLVVAVSFFAVCAWSLVAAVGGSPAHYVETQSSAYYARVVHGFDPTVRANDDSLTARSIENQYAWAAIKERPIFGGGFGQDYRPSFGVPGSFGAEQGRFYVHDWYLWLWVKAGALGLAIYLWVAVLPSIRLLKSQRALPIAATAIAFGVVSFVAPIPNSGDAGGSIAIGLLIGAALAALAATDRPRAVRPLGSKAAVRA